MKKPVFLTSIMARSSFAAAAVALGAVLLAVTAPSPAFAAGQQVGQIRGTVSDTNGQRLPGVTIIATSPALIGDARVVLSDNVGRFELVNLPPGSYTLEFSYAGTESNTRMAMVRMGETVPLNVTYELTSGGVSRVDLTQARSLTRPDSTHTGSTRQIDTLNRLPMARQYQSVAQQVPGVTGGANPNIKGGLSSHNRFLIDGMDVTDPVSNTFATNLSFDSMEAVEILTGGFDAEYNALGGVINVIPRGGGDDFHLTTSAIANPFALTAKGNYGPNLWEGLQPRNDAEAGPQSSYEFSVNAGGPLIKRKLWYGATYQFNLTKASLIKADPLGVPPYDIQHPARTYLGHMIRLRLDYAPTARHRLRVSFSADPASLDNTTQSNSVLGIAEVHQNQGGSLTQLRWDWLIGENMTATVLGGYLFSGLEIGPQGRLGSVDYTGCDKFTPTNCKYDPNRPRRSNTLDGTAWYQGGNYRTDNRNRIQVDPSLSLRGEFFGRHNAKAGLQLQYLWRTRHQETPGGSVFQDTSPTGTLLEAGLCDPATMVGCDRRVDIDSYDIKETGYAAGLFLQDHWWTPLQWLTVVPGMRFDFGITKNVRGQEVTRLFGIAPRLGLTADVTRDGRNILFGYYGRSTDPMPLGVVADVDQTEYGRTRTYEIDEMTGTYGTTPIQQTGGPGGVKVDKNTTIPRTDEITVGARREFVPGTVTGVEYTWKRISHDWASVEGNRIWDPTGIRVIDYVDRDKAGQDIFTYMTPYNPRFYQGFVLKSEGRPNARWEYHASHTVSWTTFRSTVSDNPRQAEFNQGWSSADLRHYTRLQAAYYLFPNLSLGAMFQYRSQGGDTETKAFYNRTDNSRSNSRSPAGTTPTTPNDPAGLSEFRPPALTQLDLSLRYNVLPTTWRSAFSIVIDVFNVLNQRSPTSINGGDIANFGQIASRQGPLRVQLGVNYTY